MLRNYFLLPGSRGDLSFISVEFSLFYLSIYQESFLVPNSLCTYTLMDAHLALFYSFKNFLNIVNVSGSREKIRKCHTLFIPMFCLGYPGEFGLPGPAGAKSKYCFHKLPDNILKQILCFLLKTTDDLVTTNF